MAYNPMEELKLGNVSFLKNITQYDRDSLIDRIRISPDKDEILHGCLLKLKNEFPLFLYPIIYDNPKYEDIAYNLYNEWKLDINCFDTTKLYGIYTNTQYGKQLVKENINRMLVANDDKANLVLSLLFVNIDEELDLLKEISISDNLHIRYLFMRYLLLYKSDQINIFYDDITNYFTSYLGRDNEQLTFIPELMNEEDLSDLCMIMLDNNLDCFTKTKQFIFDNYEKNSLAYKLLINGKDANRLKEFNNDPINYYLTSKDCQKIIYNSYRSNIPNEYFKQIERLDSIFGNDPGTTTKLDSIYSHNLQDTLERFIDKYLAISNDKTIEYLASGSTGAAYRVGDYCFKIFRTKWSYEDVICPRNYLILKNLEEIYIRDDKNIVRAGIEVQPYLKNNDVSKITDEYVSIWYKAFTDFGYILDDNLISGECGCNAYILDDYHQADTITPDALPDWFKETPLVLIDHDRVHQRNKEKKQLISGY